MNKNKSIEKIKKPPKRLPKSKTEGRLSPLSEIRPSATTQELLSKAKLSGDLADIFQAFLSMPLPHKKRKNTKKLKKGLFLVQEENTVEEILKLILSYKRNSGQETGTWSKIFYNYMVQSTNKNRFFDFLRKEHITHYQQIINDYKNSVDKENLLQTSLAELANSLDIFFTQHKIDPFSCLIGLSPSKEIIEFTKIRSTENSDNNFSKEELTQKILNWASIEDIAQLQREVREFSGELRGVKQLQAGWIVLADIEGKIMYARYQPSKCVDNSVIIFIEPFESNPKTIRIDRIFPLHSQTTKRIQDANIEELEKLVQSPTDALYQDFMRTAEIKSYDYFASIGIDMDVIKKANNNSCSITELLELKNAQNKLEQLTQNPPTVLFQGLQDVLNSKIEFFKKLMTGQGLFKPTSHNSLQQLQNFRLKDLVMMHIHRYVGICQSGLDDLSLQKRELMNGVRKDKITAWWLHEIDTAVLSFLETFGYIHDAVPDNYVEQPPSDFKAVAKNSEILTRILNSDQTETGLKDLIEKLKNLIYPKIESFVHDAKIVLSEQFNFDLTGKDFSLPQVEAAFKREEKNIDPQIRVWIDDMIKDIHYLNEMHKLEDPNYLANLEKEGGGKHEISLHIVPISGLVAGVFCRLSNECKTVCELWEPPELDDVTDRTDLHSAVIQANFDSIFTYLQSVPDHINSQDSNGFTPLHYCASSYTLDYLNICEKLLGANGVNVNLKTNQGNTILYYLVRYPAENDESLTDHLLRVIKKAISAGADLNTRNATGETCLHSACVLDNPSVVKLLVGSSASPSIVNNDQETCIFTAVKGGNVKTIQALLSFDSALANNAKLLDLARSLNFPEVISVLTGNEVVVRDKPRIKYQKHGGLIEDRTKYSHASMEFSLEDLASLYNQRKLKHQSSSSGVTDMLADVAEMLHNSSPDLEVPVNDAPPASSPVKATASLTNPPEISHHHQHKSVGSTWNSGPNEPTNQFKKATTEPALREFRRMSVPVKPEDFEVDDTQYLRRGSNGFPMAQNSLREVWSSTPSKQNSPQKRTQISLGSNRLG